MDEEEKRLINERKLIIERYDRGREEGALIEDWEDPQLPIYHSTDRFGFIHDKPLPKTTADELRRLNLEGERVDKWLKMAKKWDKFKNSEKLRQRVYKGIPDKVRGVFWARLLDLETIKLFQKGKYQEMLRLGREFSPDVRQIDLDVNRTYRDHINFRERFSTSQKSLFNVLTAYSIYNTEVGYCQGMSQIAALLLMYLEEEDAFWALAQLMTHHKYAMHGFFVHGFPKLLRFNTQHERILSKKLSRLKKHFDKHGIDSMLYTLKWFFQCFLDRVPFELALRLWDIYIYEGERVLLIGAFTILKIHSKALLARKNLDDIIGYLQSRIPEHFGMDLDNVIELYSEYSEDLNKKGLDNAGQPSDLEFATKPFGLSIPPLVSKQQQKSSTSNIQVLPNVSSSSPLLNSNKNQTIATESKAIASTSLKRENNSIDPYRSESASPKLEQTSSNAHPPRPSSAASVGRQLLDSRRSPVRNSTSPNGGVTITSVKYDSERSESPYPQWNQSPTSSSPPPSERTGGSGTGTDRRSISPTTSASNFQYPQPNNPSTTSSTPSPSSGLLTLRIHVPYSPSPTNILTTTGSTGAGISSGTTGTT